MIVNDWASYIPCGDWVFFCVLMLATVEEYYVVDI